MSQLKYLPVLICLIFSITLQPSIAEGLDVQQIVDKVDKLYRSDTSYGEMEMIITTPNWKRRVRMKIWTEGMDKTFIYIISPKKDAGIATLRIKTEMWNYFPKINKVMKVPPSMMMASWMGSDFSNDDLVKESSLLRDYTASLINPPGADENNYYIQLIPKVETATVWGKIIITVRKKDYILLKQEYYDEKDNRMRIIEFKEVRQFGKRVMPAVMEMTPLNKEGRKTIIRYLKARFDEEFDKKIFTLRNLQKKR